ncbi:MAG: VWA domain-containing protein [Polyangiaceae bacterium]
MRAPLLLSSALLTLLLATGCGATNGGDPGGAGNGGSNGGNGGSAGGNTGGTGTAGGNTGGTGTAGGNSGGTGNGGSTGTVECVAGAADCNGDPADGCEVSLLSDVNHCGTCDTVCSGGAGVPPSCVVGECGLECPPSSGNCDKDPANGCEANLKNDAENCGGCGVSCMGEPCIDGSCACAAETTSANPVQLDLFVMLDQSGSMSNTVSGGATKWSAVTSALKSFMQDPSNTGLGVGIQYFPLSAGGQACNPVCTTDADCGAFGPCFIFVCLGCSGGGGDSCNVADYAKAEVEIAPLGGGQTTALINSLNAHGPTNDTPIGPALQGAINHAKSWKMTHPGHEVAVILATDGDPTECNPSDIPGIANIAMAGVNMSPSVKTFVIGVGSSLSNMNAIAAGGGTGSAYLVDTGGNVIDQFKAALNAIQSSALGCEYTIPAPAMGMLDYDKVNVQYTPGNGGAPQVIANVANAAACDPNTGGWYYDNPASPSKIILCDATCTPVEADASGKVDILLGCATEHM